MNKMSSSFRSTFSPSGLVNFGVILTTIMIYIGAAQAFSARNAVKSSLSHDDKLMNEMNVVTGITTASAILLTLKVGYDAIYKR